MLSTLAIRPLNPIETGLICLILLGFSLQTMAKQVLVSEGQPPQLIELYTSEGCSSCPPADRWLSQQLQNPDLWSRQVPVAFHVDYWDYLGWSDRFASAENSLRQRMLQQTGAISQVYTPGWVVDGREWRGFFRRTDYPEPRHVEGGRLQVTLDGTSAVVEYATQEDRSNGVAHFALLGFGLTTNVRGGENRGELLRHDFVVLDKQRRVSHDGRWEFSYTLPTSVEKLALAVWVTSPGRSVPHQVVGGWIKRD